MAQVKDEQAETQNENNLTSRPRKVSKHKRINSSLSQQQVEQLKIAFNLFDKDQNGAIDSNELQTVLKTLGQNIGKDDVQEMMSNIDMNDNGEIEFAEFVEMMENRMFLPSKTAEYEDAFKFFDKNGDGYIDFGELKGNHYCIIINISILPYAYRCVAVSGRKLY